MKRGHSVSSLPSALPPFLPSLSHGCRVSDDAPHHAQDSGDRRNSDQSTSNYIHYRVLVPVSRAGSLIGKGGEFITQIKDITGAKLSVDKTVQGFDERVAHIESSDTPGKELCPAQQGLLFVLERIVREEDTKLPPAHAAIKLLVFKNQITTVIGAKGATVGDIRKTTGANVRICDAASANALCLPDDELIQINGTNDQVRHALIAVSAALRRAPPPARRVPPGAGPASPHGPKRARHDGPPPANAPPGKPPPPAYQPGPHYGQQQGQQQQQQQQQHQGQHGRGGPGAPPRVIPPAVGMVAKLMPNARQILSDDKGLDLEGVVGASSVEYRILVPNKRVGAVLGKGGSVLRNIRGSSGARVHLLESVPGCPERLAVCLSTEDTRDPGCCAIDAAMTIINNLLDDELHQPPVHVQRLLLAPGQLEAVMGKGSSTIKRLRALTRAEIKPLPMKETPKCGGPNDEVLSIEGTVERVREACSIVLVALRMWEAKAQLVHGKMPPDGAPPVTRRPPGYDMRNGLSGPEAHPEYAGGPFAGAPPPGAPGGPPGPPPPRGPPPQLYDAYGQPVPLQQLQQQAWQEQQGPYQGMPPPGGPVQQPAPPQLPPNLSALVQSMVQQGQQQQQQQQQYANGAPPQHMQQPPAPQDPRYAYGPPGGPPLQDPRVPQDPRYAAAPAAPQDPRLAAAPPAPVGSAAQDPRYAAAGQAPLGAYGPVGGVVPQPQQQQQGYAPLQFTQDLTQLAGAYAPQQAPQQQAPQHQAPPQQQQQGQQQLQQVPSILQRLGLSGSGPTLGGALGGLATLGGSYGAVGEQLGAQAAAQQQPQPQQQQQQQQYPPSSQYQPQPALQQQQQQPVAQYQQGAAYQPQPTPAQQGQQAYGGAAAPSAYGGSSSYVPSLPQQQQQQQQGQYGAQASGGMGLGGYGALSMGLAGSGPTLGSGAGAATLGGAAGAAGGSLGASMGMGAGGGTLGGAKAPGAVGNGAQGPGAQQAHAGAGAAPQTSLKLLISAQQVELLHPKLEQIRLLSGAGIMLYNGTTPSGDREMEITGSMAQATAAQNFIQVLITSGLS